MKKFLLVIVFTIAIQSVSMGQFENTIHPYISKNGIGLRFFLGIGVKYTSYSDFEISYQRHIYRNIRGEVNTSFGFGGGTFFSFVPEIQAVWKIIKGLNVYTGACMGYISNSRVSPKRTLFGVGPSVGLEYNFGSIGAPIIFAVSYRPLYFTTEAKNKPLGTGSGIAIRYVF